MIIGWSMQPTLARDLVLDALLVAVWRRKPKQRVIMHSDQGSQYGSDDWIRFCKAHKLDPSMSRRGNWWDNAVAESFFGTLKNERIDRRPWLDRESARNAISEYIEVFYNRIRKHSTIGNISPAKFEEMGMAQAA
jgi:putative transposase